VWQEQERARETNREREKEREREREAANIDLDKHFASFSQHPQCLFSTFSLPSGDGYTDLYPSLCCRQHTALAYYAIQIYEAYHLIMREFVIYTGDKAVLTYISSNEHVTN
jgi:hypothetical protein